MNVRILSEGYFLISNNYYYIFNYILINIYSVNYNYINIGFYSLTKKILIYFI